MRSITIPLDDALLERAEQKALALSTSVPAVVAEYLRDWTTDDRRLAAAQNELKSRFARRDWDFAVGMPDDRSQRNARR